MCIRDSDKRIYNGWGSPEPETALRFGPNIKDWPQQPELTDDLLVKIVSYITDPVTTTDELIPSGETSSFRSNPLRLAEFTPVSYTHLTTPSSYVMAKNMGHEGVLTASCVAATTLFSALSLTFWIFVLRSGGYIA